MASRMQIGRAAQRIEIAHPGGVYNRFLVQQETKIRGT
jgi:hypothetical protein